MHRARRVLVAVVALVALVACAEAETPGPTFGAAGESDVAPTGPGEAAAPQYDVTVRAVESTAFQPVEANADAGAITIALENATDEEHTLTIEGHEEALHLRAAPGKTTHGTIELPAGEYVYYCSVPGHREGGQQGTLRVEA
ncbi:MAG TPA: hypothetical protein VHF25_12090 [Nitriliruptorales bacterium]|nr:hypothetical protein [Nitriliruptorales bacterium]